MLIAITLLIMAVMAAVFWKQGVFTAFIMCVCVVLAGILAFNFWEPLADQLEPSLRNTPLRGLEDFLSLVGIFVVALGVLRLVANLLGNRTMEYPSWVGPLGGAFFGLVTGYLVSGFLVAALQMLPLDEKPFGFEPENGKESSDLVRSLMPPDLFWLSMMRHASENPFARRAATSADGQAPEFSPTAFDPKRTFEWRYQNRRRSLGKLPPVPHFGSGEKKT
jgi:hypothetical protein